MIITPVYALTPGIQSPNQMELLAQHNPCRPVVVEGPHPLWLGKTCVYYYVLRAEPVPSEEKVRRVPSKCLIFSVCRR